MPPDLLFISDLDGTLLNRRGELSERSRRGVRRLIEEGMRLTLASARSHVSIKSIFGPMPFVLPIIEFNGAFITDYSSGEHLQINALEPEVSLAILEVILLSGLRPFVSTFNGRDDCLYFDQLINFGMKWYIDRRRQAGDHRLRQIDRLEDALCDHVVSMTVMNDDLSVITELQQRLADQLPGLLCSYCYENAYSKGTYWLTVHHPRANKQVAMQHLRDQFAPGCHVTAFGDHMNDLEMITLADHGVAVSNAIPELKAVAREVIGDCDKDSVICYLETRAGKYTR